MTSSTGNTGPTNTGKYAADKVPKGYKTAQLQQYTPEQLELMQQMMNNVGPDSYLSKLAAGDQSLFDEMEAPALRQFTGIQGQMASRFSGMGTGGRKSSGFQNSMTAAGSDFAQDLQAKRMELRNQAIKDLHGMSSDLLDKRPYERSLVEKQQKKSGWGAAAGAAVGAAGGYMVGDPVGGAKVGYAVGSQF